MSLPSEKISRRTDFLIWNVEWPGQSQDLSLFGFFLWGHSKETIYTYNLQTVNDLEGRIDKVITNIGSKITKPVIDSVEKSAQDCIPSGGNHF